MLSGMKVSFLVIPGLTGDLYHCFFQIYAISFEIFLFLPGKLYSLFVIYIHFYKFTSPIN